MRLLLIILTFLLFAIASVADARPICRPRTDTPVQTVVAAPAESDVTLAAVISGGALAGVALGAGIGAYQKYKSAK